MPTQRQIALARGKRVRAKAAMGATHKARQQPRPSPGPRPTPQKVKFLKAQTTLKARATVFARQQREKRIRSIVARRGRGRQPAASRLKQFAGAAQFEILERRAVNSSWVREILLVMFNGQPALGIVFLDGARIVYTQTSLTDFELMAAAGSKGKFIWARLYHGVPGAGSPYEEF